MKKSTILLLVVVYILSFFIIGLLGNSIRSYNPTIDVTSIELVEPDNKTTRKEDVKDTEGNPIADYYFIYRNYSSLDKVRIKAIVKPDNSTYNTVDFIKDAQNETFNFKTHETNPDEIEPNFVEISLNEIPETPLSARFVVRSTNPGIKIEVIAQIVFANL